MLVPTLVLLRIEDEVEVTHCIAMSFLSRHTVKVENAMTFICYFMFKIEDD